MPTLPLPACVEGNGYPTTDHKPMAETDYHRDLMLNLIETLRAFYIDEPQVYVSGNLLLFYEEGDRRKHVSPDVFVVRGVGNHQRPNFLLWEEGCAPQFVIELTSSSTRKADIGKKMSLYRDVLKVREYFLFDPKGDYLKPSMQGWRLVRKTYQEIRPVMGRIPSRELGLHLEREGDRAYLWNPDTGRRLLTPTQQAEEENARLRRLLEQAGIRVDATP